MARTNPLFTPAGFQAENDLSTKQFYFVELGASAGEVDVCDNAGDLVIGVLQNKPTAGQAAEVMTHGIAKVIAGGTIARQDRVGTDANGKAVAKTADAALVAGIALSAAAAGEYVEILLTPGAQRAA